VVRLSCWRWKKKNAIADLRKLMGETNPANAEEGTNPQEVGVEHEHNGDSRLRRRRYRPASN